MRSLFSIMLTLSLVWSASASAQPVYGDDEDPDEGAAYGSPEAVPTPPPAPAAAPAAPAPPLPPAPDDQQTWKYHGPHAVNAQYGTGFCTLQGAHFHPYPPFDDHLFQEQDGGYNFLGDPTDFGYAGEDLSWYSAVHPIAIGWGIGWCFMTWPHRHLYRPWGPYFSACGPYSCYSGPFDAYYWRWRGYWTPYWGAYYPRFYRGGTYFRTRVSASPGRWAHAGMRHPGGLAGGHLGRPGGYARPVPGHAAGGLHGHGTPYTRLPHTTPIRPGARLAPTPHPTPRLAPPRAAPAPRHISAPKTHGAPRFSAPKSFGSSRSSSPSRPSSRSSGGGKRR
jgi:hypothetical protein